MTDNPTEITTAPLDASPTANKQKLVRRLKIVLVVSLMLAVLSYPQSTGELLRTAARQGNAPLVRFLLWIGVDKNSSGWDLLYGDDYTPLMLAAQGGSLAAVRVLIEHDADVKGDASVHYENPLICAAMGGNPAIVRLLIAKGAPLNDSYDDGGGALYYARAYHHPEVVQILKKAGAVE